MLMFWRVLQEEGGGGRGCWGYRFLSSLYVNYYYPRFMETLLCTVTLLKSIKIVLSIANPIQLLPITPTKAAEKEYLDEGKKLEATHFHQQQVFASMQLIYIQVNSQVFVAFHYH